MRNIVLVAIGAGVALGLGTSAALAEGDIDGGEKWAKRVCKACHTFDSGEKHLIGPNLWNIVGAVPGTREGFNGYKVAPMFVENGVETWTEEALVSYVTDSAAFRDDYAGGEASAMILAPLTPEIATDVVAYLKTLSD